MAAPWLNGCPPFALIWWVSHPTTHLWKPQSTSQTMATPGSTSKYNLLDLPIEVLSKVFETLCLHCQTDPSTVADYDTSGAWESKRSLARICRACHTTRSIAQPILFHYYASGNMQKLTGFREILSKPEEDDLLPVFLCSVIRKPMLAGAVRVLSLVPGTLPNGITQDIACLLIEESRRIRLTPQIDEVPILPEVCRTGTAGEVYSGVHLWLQGLAISICPNIEQLHIDYRPPSWLPILAPRLVLDRLKILAFNTHGQTPQFYAPPIAQLLNVSPNLRCLEASNIDFNFELIFEIKGVKKLSINGPTSGILRVLLSGCSSLEDLEYYQDPFLPRIANEADFEPVRYTLRRLCFSVVPHAAYPGQSRYGPKPTSRDTSYFTMLAVLDKVDCGVGLSLRNFDRLEILEIDYFLLYGRARDFKDGEASPQPRLPTILPDSIRILHIGFVTDWNHMCCELIALASDIKAGGFPYLATIRVDVVTSACIFQFYSAVEVEMSLTKVDFVLGLCPTSSVPRGMLPGRPAGADVPPDGMVNYVL